MQEDHSETHPSVVLHQWCPLDIGVHKINFDAVIFKASNSTGLGVIVHDWRGKAVGALSMTIPMANSVVDVEALACRQAMNFAIELGLQRVVF